VPANLHHSSLVRRMADEVFKAAKFGKAWASRLKLVVDELFMNAVKYGSTEEKSFVYTTFEYNEKGIQFTIEDDGTGSQVISPEELQAKVATNEQDTNLTKTSGRGLSMITKLWTDKMEVSKSQYGGISVKFTKAIETATTPPPPPTGLVKQITEQMATPTTPTAPSPPPEIPPPPAVPSGAQPAKGPAYEIKLSGEIDQSNIEEKTAPVYDQIEVMPEGGTLVLDFSELDYINSTFIGNLAAWHTSLRRKNGRICLKNTNNQIREVLELVGLLNILECPV